MSEACLAEGCLLNAPLMWCWQNHATECCNCAWVVSNTDCCRAGYMLNLVAKHLNPTEIGSLRESFLAMVRPTMNAAQRQCDGRGAWQSTYSTSTSAVASESLHDMLRTLAFTGQGLGIAALLLLRPELGMHLKPV